MTFTFISLLYFSFKSLGYCLIVALGLRIVFRSTRSWTGRRLLLCHQGATTGSYDDGGPSLRRRRSSSSSSSSSSYLTSSSSGCWWMMPAGRAAGMLVVHCLFLVGAVLLAVTFATKTWTRNLDWADRRTLFEQVLLIQSSSLFSVSNKLLIASTQSVAKIPAVSHQSKTEMTRSICLISLFSPFICVIFEHVDPGWHSVEYAEL
jgi:hypothetical protein